MNLLRLKDVLKEKSITGKELASKVNISETGMSNIVKGQSLPRQDVLLKIAEELNVDIRELFNQTKIKQTETIYVNRGEKFIPIGEIRIDSNSNK